MTSNEESGNASSASENPVSTTVINTAVSQSLTAQLCDKVNTSGNSVSLSSKTPLSQCLTIQTESTSSEKKCQELSLPKSIFDSEAEPQTQADRLKSPLAIHTWLSEQYKDDQQQNSPFRILSPPANPLPKTDALISPIPSHRQNSDDQYAVPSYRISSFYVDESDILSRLEAITPPTDCMIVDEDTKTGSAEKVTDSVVANCDSNSGDIDRGVMMDNKTESSAAEAACSVTATQPSSSSVPLTQSLLSSVAVTQPLVPSVRVTHPLFPSTTVTQPLLSPLHLRFLSSVDKRIPRVSQPRPSIIPLTNASSIQDSTGVTISPNSTDDHNLASDNGVLSSKTDIEAEHIVVPSSASFSARRRPRKRKMSPQIDMRMKNAPDVAPNALVMPPQCFVRPPLYFMPVLQPFAVRVPVRQSQWNLRRQVHDQLTPMGRAHNLMPTQPVLPVDHPLHSVQSLRQRLLDEGSRHQPSNMPMFPQQLGFPPFSL